MSVTAAGANLYLNGGDVAPVKIVLHTAAPNATASNFRIGSLLACTFTTSTAAERVLSADVDLTVPAGVTTATHYSVYNASDVALHIVPLDTPLSGLIEGRPLKIVASGTKLTAASIYVAP
jgi:hypothetical protein